MMTAWQCWGRRENRANPAGARRSHWSQNRDAHWRGRGTNSIRDSKSQLQCPCTRLFRRKLGRPDSDFLNVCNGNKTGRKWFSSDVVACIALQAFQPSPRRPDQAVCSHPECQARRRAVITAVVSGKPMPSTPVRDSCRKWRESHPDYQRNYWQTHPDAAPRQPPPCGKSLRALRDPFANGQHFPKLSPR